jgi:hypothetical protein|tara:strand:- start:2754 stop:2891 length:138 start_codon:yes stop_codon:yes gene_type:complete
MPTYLRRYYLKRLQKQYEDERVSYDKEAQKIQKPGGVSRPPKVSR